MIPEQVKTTTIPAGTPAKARPAETVNAPRSTGGEVRRGEYTDGPLSKREREK
jgi:hypothetical protein